MALTVIVPPTTVPVSAAFGSTRSEGDRTIWLHHTHTGETGRFTFKRNGKYDQSVLRQLNVFLADWRTKEPTKMDPALFDLLWEVYQDVGAKQPYNIVSSYRSPKTNAMLASKSSGVADNSQHMRGKAMDVFIPGVNLDKLRAAAMRHQVGGVGYYPTSGSPFVHMDTGNVRAWPRMTRAQLKKVFPDGKTLHLPADGKPLSSDGRAYAQAQWTKCRMVPCNGEAIYTPEPDIMLADNGNETTAPIPAIRPRTLSGGAAVMLASVEEPAQRMVPTFAVTAPLPLNRAGAIPTTVADIAAYEAVGAPVPLSKSERIQLATRGEIGADTAIAALASIDQPLPKPRVHMSPREGEVLAAYVSTSVNPAAQQALQMLIERETALVPELPSREQLLAPDNIHTASLGGAETFAAAKGMFDQTFVALVGNSTPTEMQQALANLAQSRQPNLSIALRSTELVAPEIDHVNDTLVQPVSMETAFWAEFFEAEGYLDKTTELGPLTGRVGFLPDNAVIPSYDRFVTSGIQLVAER
ncbi:DUF882 domain-containing protein [Devosia sp. ZB163]|uniref:DUF882 domain-containing protein n=1 Tax=Devosia sp. ZB163 TaxID=3025938 RepID=UPI002361947F|nr:DUF882 domain-containing protein [Devosia sp. ZB163]MDC9825025.1 DUF882 domain-containing protein [Devosia sp. ZB163]